MRWCGASDPLRQALGADVLARLTAHRTAGAAAFPGAGAAVLRELGREVREAEPALAVVRALGAQGDPAVLPDVLRHANCTRTPGAAQGGGRGDRARTARAPGEAVAALTVLARDGDAGSAGGRGARLAVAAEDSAVREVLAEASADPDPVTAAEAARGPGAIRQDPRAVDALDRILVCDPDGRSVRGGA